MDTSASPADEPLTFRAVIQQSGKTATGIPVPAAIVARLGAGKRPAVQVTLQGYTYRSTVAPLGGTFMLPLSAEHRAGAGVVAGDAVEVMLVRDTAPRVVSVPPDLAAALATDANAQRVFAELSYSNQQRVVLPIEEAKTPETRQRRIAAAVGRLRGPTLAPTMGLTAAHGHAVRRHRPRRWHESPSGDRLPVGRHGVR